jgi:hypothetical protein
LAHRTRANASRLRLPCLNGKGAHTPPKPFIYTRFVV